MKDILVGKNILIVEDETDLREPLVTEFESLGCRVFQAKNGKEGLEIVHREKLDAVISDIRMPGGDGVELLKEIKNLDHQFPVVMLITGFSDLSKEEAYHLGAEAILSKPFNLDEIDDAVTRILTPREKRWQQKGDEKEAKLKIQKSFTVLKEAIKNGYFGLGRGGFFINETSALIGRNELLSFQVRFETGQILSLEGTGLCRWVRKDESEGLLPGCGIEFESLPSGVRENLIDLIDSVKMVPFIPKGSNTSLL